MRVRTEGEGESESKVSSTLRTLVTIRSLSALPSASEISAISVLRFLTRSGSSDISACQMLAVVITPAGRDAEASMRLSTWQVARAGK